MLSDEQKTEIRKKIREKYTPEQLQPMRDKFLQIKADHEKRREAFRANMAAAKARHDERQAILNQLFAASKEAGEALQKQAEVLRDYVKAPHAAISSSGSKTPLVLKNVEIPDMKTIGDLLAAAYKYAEPFPPEDLKEAWANFQAQRANKGSL